MPKVYKNTNIRIRQTRDGWIESTNSLTIPVKAFTAIHPMDMTMTVLRESIDELDLKKRWNPLKRKDVVYSMYQALWKVHLQ